MIKVRLASRKHKINVESLVVVRLTGNEAFLLERLLSELSSLEAAESNDDHALRLEIVEQWFSRLRKTKMMSRLSATVKEMRTETFSAFVGKK